MLDRIVAAVSILNLRHVNQLVRKQKFKYEDLRIAMTLFRSGEYMYVIKSRVTTMWRWWRHIASTWVLMDHMCSLNLCDPWLSYGDLRGYKQ